MYESVLTIYSLQVLAGSVVGAIAEEKENGDEADSKPPPASDQADDSSNRCVQLCVQGICRGYNVNACISLLYRYQVVGTVREEDAECPGWVQEIVQVNQQHTQFLTPL